MMDICITAKYPVKKGERRHAMQGNVSSVISDKLQEARNRLKFMTQAIGTLWGDRANQYGLDIVDGCMMIMHDIEHQFAEVHSALEPK